MGVGGRETGKKPEVWRVFGPAGLTPVKVTRRETCVKKHPVWSREVWQSCWRVFESESEDRGSQVSQEMVCLSISSAISQ